MPSKSSGALAVKLGGYFLLGLIIYLLLNHFSLQIDVDNLIRSAFIDLIIGVFWEFVFNRWLWRTRVFRTILNIKTPYIHGRWKGHIKSSFDNFQTQFPIVIEICQTYKSTQLTYYDQRSMSRALVTEFFMEEGALPKLLCIYRNEPTVAHKKNLQIHYGTMILTIPSNWTKISGVYFNYFLQRETYGELSIELEHRKLKYGL